MDCQNIILISMAILSAFNCVASAYKHNASGLLGWAVAFNLALWILGK